MAIMALCSGCPASADWLEEYDIMNILHLFLVVINSFSWAGERYIRVRNIIWDEPLFSSGASLPWKIEGHADNMESRIWDQYEDRDLRRSHILE